MDAAQAAVDAILKKRKAKRVRGADGKFVKGAGAKKAQVALPPGEPQDVEAYVIDDEPKRGPGRPTSYTDEMPARVFLAVPNGATLDAIANVCDVSRPTVENWMKAHEEFLGAVNAARKICDDRVEQSLFRKATGYTVTQQVYDKRAGNIRELEISVPADTVSCIFFLKNRRPQDWRDKHDVEMTGPNGGPIQHEHLEGVPTAELIAEAEGILAAARSDHGGADEA